ncbi:hypothetical protein AB4172_23890 [Vibrio splendidus]
MVYFLGLVMGYFSGVSHLIQQEIREEKFRYSNPMLGLFSTIGKASSISLMVAAFYFIMVSRDSGILEGIYFILASFVGMFFSGYFERFRLNPLISLLTIFVNLGLLFQVYSLTQ